MDEEDVRVKAAEMRAEVARQALLELERERLAKANRMERAGADSENRGKGSRYLRPDGSPMPGDQRRDKSRERKLERKGKGEDAPPPPDGLRGEKPTRRVSLCARRKANGRDFVNTSFPLGLSIPFLSY